MFLLRKTDVLRKATARGFIFAFIFHLVILRYIVTLLYRSGVIDLSSWSLPQKYYKETCSEAFS